MAGSHSRPPIEGSTLGPAVIVAAGLVLGLIVGAVRERSTITALLLWSEPLPAVIGVCLVHLCFVSGRWTHGVATAVATVSYLLLARTVPVFGWRPLPGEPPSDVETLGACGQRAALPDSWILAVWSGADDVTTLQHLIDVSDVVVLLHPALPMGDDGPTMPTDKDAVGEFLTVPGRSVVWSRAGFAACGDSDTWPIGLHSALVYVAPAPETAVPLVVSDLAPLGEELDRDVGAIGALARSMGGSLVVAASATFPTSFRATDLTLLHANLRSVAIPPNAPEAVGRLPLLTLRPVNRVWVTDDWSARAEVLESGTSLAAPVVLRLDAYQTP